jgi:hypothetical protein
MMFWNHSMRTCPLSHTRVSATVSAVRPFRTQALRQQFRTDVGEDKYNDINWVFSDESDELWETYIGPRRKRQEELLKAHPLVHSPDEQCYECGGSGFVTSTYNQNAQWDFWEVGGRWYGAWNARNDRNDSLVVFCDLHI